MRHSVIPCTIILTFKWNQIPDDFIKAAQNETQGFWLSFLNDKIEFELKDDYLFRINTCSFIYGKSLLEINGYIIRKNRNYIIYDDKVVG